MGQMYGCIVGGIRNRWEFLLIGKPLEEMAHAEEKAEANDRLKTVVVSPSFWQLVKENFRAVPVSENGNP